MKQTVKCPKCGQEPTEPTDNFCMRCAEDLRPLHSQCPHCNHSSMGLNTGEYCPNCGKAISAPQEAQV